MAAVAALALSLPACGDLLTETPQDFLAGENFWSPTTAETAVNGIYYGMARSMAGNHNNLHFMLDSQTGDEGRQRAFFVHPLFINTYWERGYETINRANEVIEKVPGIKGMDANLQKRLVGEAHFMRAYVYFHLVQLWGDVPLLLEPTRGTASVEVGRTPVAEVYKAIIADLKAAVQALPARYTDNADVGRATSGAAKGFLAKAYLTMAGDPLRDRSHLAEARQLLTEIMQSGAYRLEAKYENNFDAEDKNGPESLFEIQQARLGALGNNHMIWHFPTAPGLQPEFGRGFNNIMIMPGLMSAFEPGDLRKNMIWTEHLSGNRVIRFNFPFHKKYYDFGAPGKNYLWSQANIPRLRYSDVLLMFAEVENELNGPTAAAYEAVNQVRARAGLPPLRPGLGKADFLEAMLHERRVELYGEAQRWFDLKRHGRLLQAALSAGYGNAASITEKNLLLPIPESELLQNRKLTQNPGW